MGGVRQILDLAAYNQSEQGKTKKQSKSYRKIPQDHEYLVSGGCMRCPAVEHSTVQGMDSLQEAVYASEGSAGANQVVPKKVDERLADARIVQQ
jgi:hypothetical protein